MNYFIWCYYKFVTSLLIYAAWSKHTTSKLFCMNLFSYLPDFYAGIRLIIDLCFLNLFVPLQVTTRSRRHLLKRYWQVLARYRRVLVMPYWTFSYWAKTYWIFSLHFIYFANYKFVWIIYFLTFCFFLLIFIFVIKLNFVNSKTNSFLWNLQVFINSKS